MHDAFVAPVDGTRRIEDGLPLIEAFFLQPPDVPQPDDSLLDGWLASLTPDQFEPILDWLTRPHIVSSASVS